MAQVMSFNSICCSSIPERLDLGGRSDFIAAKMSGTEDVAVNEVGVLLEDGHTTIGVLTDCLAAIVKISIGLLERGDLTKY